MTRSTAQAESATQAFAELVVMYRDLLEKLAANPRQDVFAQLHANLVNMVSGVLPLRGRKYYPQGISSGGTLRGAADYELVYQNLYATLDPLETRLAKIHCILEGAIEWRGNLSEHLGDIYDDVMEGLRLYEQGGHKAHQRAAGHWHVGFDIHWGQNHVYNALFILHYFVYNFEDLEEDECEDE